MNRTSLTLVVPLILLAAIATTPVMITEDAFARHAGGNLNQAASVSNSCLNPISNSNTNNNMISNGNCGGTISQQGRSGQASSPTTVQSANPNIEVQRSTTTAQPPTTPNPSASAILQVQYLCHGTNGRGCPPSFLANITITGNNPQPRNFLLASRDSQLVKLGAGNYTVTQQNFGQTFTDFAVNCRQSGLNSLTATGTIAAGQAQICIIQNIFNTLP